MSANAIVMDGISFDGEWKTERRPWREAGLKIVLPPVVKRRNAAGVRRDELLRRIRLCWFARCPNSASLDNIVMVEWADPAPRVPSADNSARLGLCSLHRLPGSVAAPRLARAQLPYRVFHLEQTVLDEFALEVRQAAGEHSAIALHGPLVRREQDSFEIRHPSPPLSGRPHGD